MTGQVIVPKFKSLYCNRNKSLEKPVALVTGSGQGIGLSIKKELKNRNFVTCLNDIAMTNKVKLALEETQAFPAIGDISNKAQVYKLVNCIIEKYGHIDVFVANAAYMKMTPFEELSKMEFNKHINVNIARHLNCLSPVITIMKKQQKKGKIILFSSMFGTQGWKNACSYASTKAAMVGLGQCLSKELSQYGISVSIISPGVIDTLQLQDDAIDAGVSIEKIKKIYEKDIPIGRIGSPDDVAYLVGFFGKWWE